MLWAEPSRMQQRLNVLNLAPHPFGKPGLLHDTTQHRSAATALPAPHVKGAMEGTNQAFDIGRCHGERVTPELPIEQLACRACFQGSKLRQAEGAIGR